MVPASFATERLLLRPPRLSDAAAVFSGYAADPVATRYLTWRPHASIAITVSHFERLVEALSVEHRAEITWVLCERSDEDRALGMISLRLAGFKGELGYVLAPAAWGRGYMPEAVRALVQHAFDGGLYRVAAYCDHENRASARVLEKAGFEREGLLRRYALHPNVSSEPRDAIMFATSR